MGVTLSHIYPCIGEIRWIEEECGEVTLDPTVGVCGTEPVVSITLFILSFSCGFKEQFVVPEVYVEKAREDESKSLIDENGKPTVPISSTDPYSWVKGEVREIASWFSDTESVAELGDPLLWVREGRDIKVQFVPCSTGDRVFHKGEGWEYFYTYTTLFIDLGVRFPFSQFEYGVLSQMKCAPTQIYPNAWGFIKALEVLMDYLGQEPLLESSYKDFKTMYVKVTFPEEEFPFYVDECLLERFPLTRDTPTSESDQVVPQKSGISFPMRRRALTNISNKCTVSDLTLDAWAWLGTPILEVQGAWPCLGIELDA
ncbi:hypothetical protein PIB30_078574 [Stylosanthes scabra]|uniref:Uncharacterized protein n=1 Tax=Stylosanthes scabra TaxID=79078 RepID=A0ABU6VUE0_9FABA|nr:hypothetical protein [Stylosanthes scabra]